jgi:outer membrane protein assembly factor BamB
MPTEHKSVRAGPSSRLADWRSRVLIVGFSGVVFVALTAGSPANASAGVATTSSWTVYHGDAAGSGVAPNVTSVATSVDAWRSPVLDGSLYGEPLVSLGMVYVATEDNTVYALSSTTGRVMWSTHIAAPVPASSLPCGDISPTVGITGTPVIDETRHEIFVVADEFVNGKAAHTLVGLSTASGVIELTQDVDPPGANPTALLQRTGLALDAGQVIFAMGGNFGDCASYRGRVAAVSESGSTPAFFTVDGNGTDSQGAIWMGGAAPEIDKSGNIWVSVGNGSVNSASQPYDDSDSVLELSSSLQLLQYFAPSSWPHDNANDLDMSMAPALLTDGHVVLAGKSRIAYLLDGSHLGGIGGQEASLGAACSQDIDGGSAVVGTTVYLPCLSGVVALGVSSSPPSMRVLWASGTGGGPPIVAAGLIWSISEAGTLYGLDSSTGAVRQQASIGVPANHFSTPSVGDGLLLASSANRVTAFAAGGPTTQPETTTVPTSGAHSAPGQAGSGAGTSIAGTVVGIAAGALLVLAGVGGIVWRRRRNGVSPP